MKNVINSAVSILAGVGAGQIVNMLTDSHAGNWLSSFVAVAIYLWVIPGLAHPGATK